MSWNFALTVKMALICGDSVVLGSEPPPPPPHTHCDLSPHRYLSGENSMFNKSNKWMNELKVIQESVVLSPWAITL